MALTQRLSNVLVCFKDSRSRFTRLYGTRCFITFLSQLNPVRHFTRCLSTSHLTISSHLSKWLLSLKFCKYLFVSTCATYPRRPLSSTIPFPRRTFGWVVMCNQAIHNNNPRYRQVLCVGHSHSAATTHSKHKKIRLENVYFNRVGLKCLTHVGTSLRHTAASVNLLKPSGNFTYHQV
jgi:hypothetical protein